MKGELDPLWMTFKSNEVVYPMRPTALARSPELVLLYILADHRMDISGLHTSFAGGISPADLPAREHPLQQVVDRKYFLTKLQTVIRNPAKQVTDDYFANQAPDVEYRDVEYVYQSFGGTPVLFGLSFAVVVLVAVILAIVIRRRRKGSGSG